MICLIDSIDNGIPNHVISTTDPCDTDKLNKQSNRIHVFINRRRKTPLQASSPCQRYSFITSADLVSKSLKACCRNIFTHSNKRSTTALKGMANRSISMRTESSSSGFYRFRTNGSVHEQIDQASEAARQKQLPDSGLDFIEFSILTYKKGIIKNVAHHYHPRLATSSFRLHIPQCGTESCQKLHPQVGFLF